MVRKKHHVLLKPGVSVALSLLTPVGIGTGLISVDSPYLGGCIALAAAVAIFWLGWTEIRKQSAEGIVCAVIGIFALFLPARSFYYEWSQQKSQKVMRPSASDSANIAAACAGHEGVTVAGGPSVADSGASRPAIDMFNNNCNIFDDAKIKNAPAAIEMQNSNLNSFRRMEIDGLGNSPGTKITKHKSQSSQLPQPHARHEAETDAPSSTKCMLTNGDVTMTTIDSGTPDEPNFDISNACNNRFHLTVIRPVGSALKLQNSRNNDFGELNIDQRTNQQ